jgi:cellulose synthase/poly-beta-1,6-N-acetylglucosamine synthase-like glycosyltransferase
MKKYKWIKLLVAPNTNIAQGRNLAIKTAKNQIIAVTDAGCVLDRNWLKNITKPFNDKSVDVVAGVYKPLWKNEFQYYEGIVICPDPEKINTPSRMSSRSLAFRKKCWKAVGGYPEKYDIGEDTLFNLKLMEKGFKFAFAKNAVVYWEMRKTWKALFKQFYRYGIWDRISGNILKLKFNLLMVTGFWGLLILSILFDIRLIALLIFFFILDLFRTTPKIFQETEKIKAFFYGVSILLVKRIAYIIGVSFGRATRY